MKIVVIVLWGLTFATFLTLLVCLPSLRCRFYCLPPYLPWLFIIS